LRVRPRPSRTLALWWGTVHALAAVGVLASALPHPVAALVLGALLVHSRWRRPRSAQPLDLCASGAWNLPASGLADLTLAEGTAVGPFWIKLVLARVGGTEGGRARARVHCLLLSDQLDPDTWRALQAELRRGARSDAH
jgi:hypothetical protein